MEADFEVQIGGGAQVIEAHWEGFVDLRQNSERVYEISEAALFPPLARTLLALNAPGAPLWTAKCDIWDPHESGAEAIETVHLAPSEHHHALACYIDLLPRPTGIFADWKDAEAYCRRWVSQIEVDEEIGAPRNTSPDTSCDLIVRQAFVGEREGFAITAYLGVVADYRVAAEEALAAALELFVAATPLLPAA